MKKLLVIASFAIISFSTFAQTEQGKILVDAQTDLTVMFSSEKREYDNPLYSADKYTATTILVTPSVGYFVVDNFAAGLMSKIGISSLKDDDSKYSSTYLNIGSFARYYFGSSNFRPFFHADGYIISNFYKSENTNYSQMNSEGKETGFGLDLGLGGSYFANENLSINTALLYNYSKSKDDDDPISTSISNGISLNIGFSLFF